MADKTTIADATLPALLAYAETMGLDVPEDATRAKVTALLQQAGLGEDMVPAVEDRPKRGRPSKAAETAAPGEIDRAALEQAMVTIHLPESETDADMEFVAVNGVATYVKRGQPQAIRFPFYVALKNARRQVYKSSMENGLGESHLVPGVPFTVVDMPEIVRRWEAQQAARAE